MMNNLYNIPKAREMARKGIFSTAVPRQTGPVRSMTGRVQATR